MLEKILPWANVAYILVVALGSYGIYQLNTLVNANKDRELARYQADAKVQIEQAKSKALEADARAALANEQAEQARLELAKLRQPRTIPPEHRQEIMDELARHKGQEYELAGAGLDPETMSFLTELAAMLTAVGWERINSQAGGISASISGVLIGTPVVADVGVTVLAWQTGPDERNDESKPRIEKRMAAATDLVNLLNHRAGISSTIDIKDLPVKNRNSIRIEVGRKPQSSSTWEQPLGLIPMVDGESQ